MGLEREQIEALENNHHRYMIADWSEQDPVTGQRWTDVF